MVVPAFEAITHARTLREYVLCWLVGWCNAVVAIHTDARMADAAATAIANKIKHPEDVATIVEDVKARNILDGLIACCGDRLGLFGNFEIKKRG